jgi:peroxiredoxin
MACVTYLTEIDVAISQFRARGVRILAVSSDAPEVSLKRMREFGEFQIPLLSDVDRTAALAFGVWRANPRAGGAGGEAQHGTFIVDRDGIVRWVYVGDRPFTDIDAILTELDGLTARSSQKPVRIAASLRALDPVNYRDVAARCHRALIWV